MEAHHWITTVALDVGRRRTWMEPGSRPKGVRTVLNMSVGMEFITLRPQISLSHHRYSLENMLILLSQMKCLSFWSSSFRSYKQTPIIVIINSFVSLKYCLIHVILSYHSKLLPICIFSNWNARDISMWIRVKKKIVWIMWVGCKTFFFSKQAFIKRKGSTTKKYRKLNLQSLFWFQWILSVYHARKDLKRLVRSLRILWMTNLRRWTGLQWL